MNFLIDWSDLLGFSYVTIVPLFLLGLPLGRVSCLAWSLVLFLHPFGSFFWFSGETDFKPGSLKAKWFSFFLSSDLEEMSLRKRTWVSLLFGYALDCDSTDFFYYIWRFCWVWTGEEEGEAASFFLFQEFAVDSSLLASRGHKCWLFLVEDSQGRSFIYARTQRSLSLSPHSVSCYFFHFPNHSTN